MLSNLQVQNAKPKSPAYKLSDGRGLYLLVTPNGQKYWRFKYYFRNKERVLALGVYPDISLADARERRDEARKLKAKGIDPADFKREQKESEAEKAKNCFENIAHEWYEIQKSKWSPHYAKQVMVRLENDVFSKIGDKPITAITARELLKIGRLIQDRNAIELAHRAMQMCSQIFNYAIITDKAEYNPALTIRGALKTPQTNHYAHLSANELPGFLADLGKYDGGIQTKLAIKLALLTFVRTNELCGARWSEIDFKNKEWRIPAERMKMRSPHIVPLSTQSLTILQVLYRLNGKWEYVFPGAISKRKYMSNNTMLYALYGMGYKERTTIHGFRATASTILNESGRFSCDVIERQLAHQERNRVRAAYNHAEYLSERREMMKWWGDYLQKAGLS